ncbi:unnamed protein product [Caenorhabditis angaria]|uniref:Major sperm protein n=1 Tax=Caenorhabditis angaria TaxID=860376 RepID=A0A9P1MZ80_9PELO|nr:unnamed protein product [Caenorhabditis angaria]
MMLLSAIVAAGTAGTIVFCGQNDRDAKRNKSSKSKKGGKSGKSSGKSKKNASKRKSSRSRKSSKSSKSKRSSSKSKKSSKAGKSSRSGKSGKSKRSKSSKSKRSSKSKKPTAKKIGELDKTQKSSKSSRSSKCDKKKGSDREALKKVPNDSSYKFKSSSCSQSNGPSDSIKASNMRATPNKLPFDKHGGLETVKIANNSGARKAFKVKCTDNMLYNVNPVYGFADDGETFNIDVLRNNGELKTDNLVILATNVTKDDIDAKKVFANAPPEREMVIVPLIAAK